MKAREAGGSFCLSGFRPLARARIFRAQHLGLTPQALRLHLLRRLRVFTQSLPRIGTDFLIFDTVSEAWGE